MSQTIVRMARYGPLILLIGLAGLMAQAGGDAVPYPIVSYIAADDPSQNGWDVTEYGTGMQAGPTVDEVHGDEVWQTRLSVCELGGGISYAWPLPTSAIALASNYGWVCEVTVRLPRPNAYFTDGAVHFGLLTDSGMFSISLDATEFSSVQLIAQTNISLYWPSSPVGIHVSTDLSWHDYHTLAIRYDPSSAVASVSVDGVTVIPEYRGIPLVGGDWRLSWGVGADCASALAYWRDVRLSLLMPAITASLRPASDGGSTRYRVQWFGHTRIDYSVETSMSLTPPSWSILSGPITGQDSVCTVDVPSTFDSAFFRIAAAPVAAVVAQEVVMSDDSSSNQSAAANRRPAGQSDGSGNLAATVAADRAFPAAVAELGRWPTSGAHVLHTQNAGAH